MVENQFDRRVGRGFREKLTESQVVDFRNRFYDKQCTISDICNLTGMTRSAIYAMLSGKTWKKAGGKLSIVGIDRQNRVIHMMHENGDDRIFMNLDQAIEYLQKNNLCEKDSKPMSLRSRLVTILNKKHPNGYGAIWGYEKPKFILEY